jgi:hypothetical protein
MPAPPNTSNFAGNQGRAFLQSKIVNCLRGAWGKALTLEEIAGYVAPNAARGDGWESSLRVTVHLLRKKGWPIRTHTGYGYSYDPSLVGDPFAGKPSVPKTRLDFSGHSGAHRYGAR